ncbi:MAG: NADH-quinone oxidoreductase subunit NuoE [Rhodocyclaceae bacterium]|nr:NADH-quinone oxidoreductase subunit NuoE [Rhodocyclaceae bacterium]MBX3667766.1 NADH-quinone oxidoreductase subunit NuoE [Rhodocyclaceae bacterium]
MLSEHSRQKIDREIAKYPPEQKQSAVMASLAIVQEERGWLSNDSLREVADYLGMPPVWVLEVASFYNMYDLQPTGLFKLTICTNLPCALSGGAQAAEYLKHKLGVEFNETTPDGIFTVKEGECMGACGDAPVMIVNNRRMCSWMDEKKIDQLVSELGAAAAGKQGGK